MTRSVIGTPAQSKPVWTYTLPDGTESRVCASGIYVKSGAASLTAASLLGAVPGIGSFAVPGAPAGTRFKQLGEALSLDGRFVVFWGRWGKQTRLVTLSCPVDGRGVSRVQVAFKGRKTGLPLVDGVYLRLAAHSAQPICTLAETGMQGKLLDPYAPAGALVTTVGLERKGLRKQWLAITASMLDPQTSEAWAGVYLTRSR